MMKIETIDIIFIAGIIEGTAQLCFLGAASFLANITLFPRLSGLFGSLRISPQGRVSRGSVRSSCTMGGPLIILALWSSLFGSLGLLGRSFFHFDTMVLLAGSAAASLPVALVCSLLLGRYLTGSEAREMESEYLPGRIANVSLAIPENGVGQVSLVCNGKRVIIPARDKRRKGICRRSMVVIIGIDRNVAEVVEF